MKDKIKILFYVPSSIYGGTELLFLRFIQYLIENHTFELYIYNAENSILGGLLPSSVVQVDVLEEYSPYDILILSSKYAREFSSLFSSIIIHRTYLWQLQPDELMSQFFPYVNRFRMFGPLFNALRYIHVNIFFASRARYLFGELSLWERVDGVFYMDKSNYIETNNWIGRQSNFDIKYQPITAPSRDLLYVRRSVGSSEKLHVSIVSRVSFDFKFFPIVSAMEALSSYSESHQRNISLFVIGDGDALDSLKKISTQYANDYFDIVFYGFMPVDEVVAEIYPMIDMAIGMGTSVLDSASLGIPTLVTDVYTFNIKGEDARFRWLHQVEGFTLGEYIQDKPKNGFGMTDAINSLDSIGDVLSKQEYLYFMENHEANKVFSLFVSRIKNSIGITNIQESVRSVINKSSVIESIYVFMFSCLRYVFKKEK